MKNLPILMLISIGAISLNSTPALAAGAVRYREVKSNNLFECSTRQLEQVWTGASAGYAGATHLLMCLDGNRKAKWIMHSQIACQPPNIKRTECPLWFNNAHTQNDRNPRSLTKLEDADNTYLYNPKKTGVGTNCNIAKKSDKYPRAYYEWSCEKYTSYENLTINTKGNTPHIGAFGKAKPQFLFDTSDDPNCAKDNSDCSQDYPGLGGDRGKLDARIYIDCRGDAEFCAWRYKP
jgi:hypothetical protein